MISLAPFLDMKHDSLPLDRSGAPLLWFPVAPSSYFVQPSCPPRFLSSSPGAREAHGLPTQPGPVTRSSFPPPSGRPGPPPHPQMPRTFPVQAGFLSRSRAGAPLPRLHGAGSGFGGLGHCGLSIQLCSWQGPGTTDPISHGRAHRLVSGTLMLLEI